MTARDHKFEIVGGHRPPLQKKLVLALWSPLHVLDSFVTKLVDFHDAWKAPRPVISLILQSDLS
jgi:hypothetical protein